MLARDPPPVPVEMYPVARAACRPAGGKMVPFAGYDMPVQYPAGVPKEHLHTRSAAGLFDVSHMGQLALRAKSGRPEDAARRWRGWCRRTSWSVPAGRQRYAQFTSESGGILDDLMVANFGSHLFLVVNAACKAADEAHLRSHSVGCVADRAAARPRADRAAGPESRIPGLATLCPEVPAMRFMDAGPRIASTASTASSRAPATPARTALRFRCRPTGPKRWRKPCWRIMTCCRSGSARATACGSRPGCVLRPRHRHHHHAGRGRAGMVAAKRAAAPGGARPGGFPGRGTFCGQLEKGAPRRRVGLNPKAVPRCAKAPPCSRTRPPPNRSAAVTSGGLYRASLRRSRWVICPPRLLLRRLGVCRVARATPAAADRTDAVCSQHL